MGVADSASGEPVLAESCVPPLDVERGELLHRLVADANDLIIDVSPIALGATSGDLAGRFPLIDPRADEVGNGGFGRLDV
jgi:hypothetical protein